MSAALQMIEEVFMAFLMSIPFNLLVFYLCALQGSFIAFWITWLVSLCDGIGMQCKHPSDDYKLSSPSATPRKRLSCSKSGSPQFPSPNLNILEAINALSFDAFNPLKV